MLSVWKNGMPECWNIGDKNRNNLFKLLKLLQTHHSITPLFHYSNWAKPLSFI